MEGEDNTCVRVIRVDTVSFSEGFLEVYAFAAALGPFFTPTFFFCGAFLAR